MWMRTYALCLSVRLGVLIACISSLIYSVILSILLFVRGLSIFQPLLNSLLDNDNGKRMEQSLFSKYAEITNKYDGNVLVVYQVLIHIHILANLLGMYGIRNYYLLPMIVLDLVRIIFYLWIYINLSHFYKNNVNLGILIAMHLLAYFVTLFMVYNWAACIALYQMFSLIGTERYQTLYGTNPFQPLVRNKLIGNKANKRIMVQVWTTPIRQEKLK